MLKRKEFILGAAVGLTFAAAATAGGVITWPGAEAAPAARVGQLVPSAGAGTVAFAPPQGAPLSFADIFQQVAPAVVQIDVKTRVQRPRGMFQIPGFGAVPIPGAPGGSAEGEDNTQLAAGAGSGFFISGDGFIVTNNHVVENAEEISVKLSDGRELKGKLIGRDENTDLAVIKVEGAGFPFVSFEEQSEPRVGDWVIAVGNPFGLGGTATAGIVSARSRDLQDQSSAYVDYLQIDAAINRGNSGGPTFDIYGRVIGVNTAIFSPSGGSVGIGFAIPATTAKAVTDKLMRGESVERGYLGVQIQTLSKDAAAALGLNEDTKGAYVAEVTAGTPGERGGMKVGDVVTSVNGEAVDSSTELTRRVARARPGDTLRLEILRDGKRQTLNIRAGARPSEAELNGGDDASPQPGDSGVVGQSIEGLTVTPITSALRQRYAIPNDMEGVVVTAVAPRSEAGKMRLPVGTVIQRANNRVVRSEADLKAAVDEARSAGRPGVFLLIRVQGTNSSVVLPFAKSE
ncbi:MULTISPECIES: Do family serine endopeptidase [Brevundimonas]|uniref:Do family serine endopeptidase n=1 Tax=Brevundimonas TaxID=41275 RepID=UPI000E667CB0|nr:Do family serine endopeptidase [Brevundimonas sp. LPMIX5]RIJ67471.1 Do family serine endopeptidase [Brevundimonas sp. LPMIX5]